MKRIEELERLMEAPGFWDNPEKSQNSMKELDSLKNQKQAVEKLEEQFEEIMILIQMGNEEEDEDVLQEVKESFDEFVSVFEKMRIETLLSEEYDRNNAILTLHAGAGGTESCDWAGMLCRMYQRWADKKGYTVDMIDFLEGDEAGFRFRDPWD